MGQVDWAADRGVHGHGRRRDVAGACGEGGERRKQRGAAAPFQLLIAEWRSSTGVIEIVQRSP